MAKYGVLVLIAPVLLWAFSSGPIAHTTGVPVPGAAEPTCAQIGCHVGTALNGGGGTLTLTAAGGSTYTPGQTQTLTIQINDPAARAYGFQATARLAGDLSQQAGTFSAGANQQVVCAANALSDSGDARTGAACSPDRPLEFIEHSSALTSNTISFDWTPPAGAPGPVVIYVSANASTRTSRPPGGAHIYNSSITLQPASGGIVTPAINTGGVINAGQFGAQSVIAPGTWIEIYGVNLSPISETWTGANFHGNTAPTSLSGVGVTIGGKPAYTWVITKGQLNVQVPDIGTGPVQVVVTNPSGSSAPTIVTANPTSPGLFAPTTVNGKQYLQVFDGQTPLGSPAAPVKPGQLVAVYGIGFGPVTPAVAPGQIATGLNTLATPMTLTVGGVAVDFNAPGSYKGMAPGNVGLYQFNMVVPDLPDGDHAVKVNLGGDGTGQTISLAVKR